VQAPKSLAQPACAVTFARAAVEASSRALSFAARFAAAAAAAAAASRTSWAFEMRVSRKARRKQNEPKVNGGSDLRLWG